MADEVIRELWRIKNEIAQEHGNDLDALVAHLRNENLRERRDVVDLHSMRREFSVGEEPGMPYDPRGGGEPGNGR